MDDLKIELQIITRERDELVKKVETILSLYKAAIRCSGVSSTLRGRSWDSFETTSELDQEYVNKLIYHIELQREDITRLNDSLASARRVRKDLHSAYMQQQEWLFTLLEKKNVDKK
jgi:hypothetical protein